MSAILSHNNANSQAANSYYHTIAINRELSIIVGMKKSDARQEIADKYRRSIRAVMSKYNLKVDPWCRKAGFREGTLRNFLSGDNDSMGMDKFDMLATAARIPISELIGEEIHYKVDNDLMEKAAEAIFKAAKNKSIKLSKAQEIAYTVMFYNHIIEYRRQGSDVTPSEAIAALILKST